MERVIKKHNQTILNANQTTTTHGCNCRKKATCPLENNCLTPSIVCNAKVTSTEDPIGKNYIGLTEGPFKQRYTQHALSFRNRHYANSRELSKFIWHLKDNNTDFKMKALLHSIEHSLPSKTLLQVIIYEIIDILNCKIYLLTSKLPTVYCLHRHFENVKKQQPLIFLLTTAHCYAIHYLQ